MPKGAPLTRQPKMPTTRITEILNLQQAITGDTFLRLGIHVLEAEKLEEQQRKTQKETN